MKRLLTYCIVIICTLIPQLDLSAQERTIEVGIDEKLDAFLPLELEFTNSNNQKVKLGDIINEPVLLSLVYYECPGICSPLLTELAWTVDRVELAPLKDFKVITISFDHGETPDIAAKWKRNYLASFKRDFPDEAWIFLTGDSITIRKLTDAVGFYFKPDGDDFLHAGAVISISPKGKISRYIFGTQFNPFDIKMALIDAESGKSSPTIAKVLQFCFSYDPEGRSYTLNITRIIGTFMLLSVLAFFSVLIFKKKKVVKV